MIKISACIQPCEVRSYYKMSKLVVKEINHTFVLNRSSQKISIPFILMEHDDQRNNYHIFSVVWPKLLAD